MTTHLIDGFGRVHRDLRIAVTDRCNFRCTYCMPVEGMQWQPRSEILTFEEIERFARLMVERYGINGIRLTGGEPTVRARITVLIEKLAALGVDLSMTTNGVTMESMAHDLRAAGLQRVNISIDSLKRDRFAELTRRDNLLEVLAGIDAAVAAGFAPVKLNMVVMAGINDDELVDFVDFGIEHGVEVRFIEFMPLDADGGWNNDRVFTRQQILDEVSKVHPLDEVERTSAPATQFELVDGSAQIGVISSVSDSFCTTCDRVRITADGQFRNCLFANGETDMRALLRNGATDDELAAAIEGSVASKWAGHEINQVNFIRPSRSMSQIGG